MCGCWFWVVIRLNDSNKEKRSLEERGWRSLALKMLSNISLTASHFNWNISFFRIPDLVKDPEAEAAFEGLRGLLEASLHQDYEKQQALKKEAKLHQKKPTARKSTAASRLKRWQKNKGTARKSTTPSSRGEFSWYGVPQEPVDFNDISTRMSIGGMEITLNASKLAGMVNLKPIIRVKDCEEK